MTSAPHRHRPMTGRDPHEPHRAATPLELLYDLTLVVAFGATGEQAAHLIAEGHWAPALVGFAVSIFGAVWAWTNYTWWASAYDTDDWIVRLAVLAQMVGVVMLTLGTAELFHGLDDGWHLHNEVMVAGYVVMRVPLLFLWWRASRHDPARRATCLGYARNILVAQIGWVALILTHPPVAVWVPAYVVLFVFEMLGPWRVERRHQRTPWHPHHIAERHSLLVIIALGEGVVGTITAVRSLLEAQGWSPEAVVLSIGGVALTMGVWWMYFSVPFGWLLERQPRKAFTFSYLHIPLLGAIAGIGAGFHVAAYSFEHESHLSAAAVVATTAVPVAVMWLLTLALYHQFVPGWDRVHAVDAIGTALVLAASVALAAAGVPIAACLVITVVAPWISVVGYEVAGHRETARHLERVAEETSQA